MGLAWQGHSRLPNRVVSGPVKVLADSSQSGCRKGKQVRYSSRLNTRGTFRRPLVRTYLSEDVPQTRVPQTQEVLVVRVVQTVLILSMVVSLAGCGSDQCSSHFGNKVECGGSMENGAYYSASYDEDTGIFYGSMWCGGTPTGRPDFECTGTRGVTPQGDTLRCLDINGNPFDPSTIVPGPSGTCS